jgi:hypothetical protein
MKSVPLRHCAALVYFFAPYGGNADVDYIFDIPLKVGQSLVGFKHDEDCPAMAGADFVVLKRTAAKRSFFERLFAP